MKNKNRQTYLQLSWHLTLRYLLVYILVGSLWIALTDLLLNKLIKNPDIMSIFSLSKGLFFMLISFLTFFLMLRRRQKLWSEALNEIEIQQQTLDKSNHDLEQNRQLYQDSHEKLLQAQNLANEILDQSELVMLTFNLHGIIIHANRYVAQLLQVEVAYLVGKPWHACFKLGRSAKDIGHMIWHLRYAEPVHGWESKLILQNGLSFDMLWNIGFLRDSTDQISGIVAVGINLTEQKRMEKQIEYHLYYDALTLLPNRMYLEQEFLHRTQTGNPTNHKMGLIYLDLDNFRHINESSSYETGNTLLKLIAEVIRRTLRKTDLAVRLLADEFVVLLDPIESEEDVYVCITRLQRELRKPWQIEDKSFYITVSIGGAMYPRHGTTCEQILQNAELAMMNCKQDGRDAYCIYKPDIRSRAVKHADTLAQLRQAIEENQFILHYQPQIYLKDLSLRGLEALVRWQHPQRGLLMPVEFITLTEESGLILKIEPLILEMASRQRLRWIEQKVCPGTIAVNMSGRRFRQADLVETMAGLLETNRQDCGQLEFELTETAMLDHLEQTTEMINQLRGYGVSFALDDFGSGYASLNYLRYLPIDLVKIDRDFIRNMFDNQHDTLIVKTIIDLAHNMGLQVVAEGIETVEQYNYLKQCGCDIGQGYYFSRPLPPEELAALLKRGYWVQE